MVVEVYYGTWLYERYVYICNQVEISKQDVGFDIAELELASHMALAEASDERHVNSEEHSSQNSDSETSDDDDDGDDDDDADSDSDSSSCSSDSFVLANDSTGPTDRDRSDNIVTSSDNDAVNSRPTQTVSGSLVVTENTAAAAAEPAELVCKHLSYLTVSDESRITPVVSESPQSNISPSVQQ